MVQCYRISSALVLILAGLPLGGRAQEAHAYFTYFASDHELLGSPTGYGASVSWSVTPWAAIRLGYADAQDNFTSFGTTCLPFERRPPGQSCAETRTETARVNAGSLAVALTVGVGTRVRLSFLPGMRWMRFESTQRGEVSGRVRRANKDVFGPQAGLEVQVQPIMRLPVALSFGGFAATLPWFDVNTELDVYAPFRQTVRVRWLEAGLTISLG